MEFVNESYDVEDIIIYFPNDNAVNTDLVRTSLSQPRLAPVLGSSISPGGLSDSICSLAFISLLKRTVASFCLPTSLNKCLYSTLPHNISAVDILVGNCLHVSKRCCVSLIGDSP